MVPGMTLFRISEAAALLQVSDDTVRRWADAGRLTLTTDAGGRLAVEGAELARVMQESAAEADPHEVAPVVARSARNRLPGIVTRVLKDTVMAQVEMQVGPHRVVSLMSREAADELGLAPGVLAVASVKSTNVVIEIPDHR
jgi:molybdopterin-binding protein